LDFGLAKLDPAPNGQTTLTATEPGVVMGTICYMSPEQVRGKSVDRRSDIFSFGLVLYELLSVKRAFERSSSAETMAAIATEDPPDLPSTTPTGLRQIVARCLEKDPTNRFQTANDLAFALRTLSGSELLSVESRPATATRPGNRWRLMVPLLTLGVFWAIWTMVRQPNGMT
jgi:serine/threonine protein kinase